MRSYHKAAVLPIRFRLQRLAFTLEPLVTVPLEIAELWVSQGPHIAGRWCLR